jgi:hypothetical protein
MNPRMNAGGLQLGASCYYRPHDWRPGNVYRGIDVGITAETALLTEKGGLGLAIRFFAMSALTARAGRIARVNQFDLNANPSSLVTDKLPKLIESPGMPFIAVFALNRCPVLNASEVFKSQCLAQYDRFMYQDFTYSMVRIFLKAFLASAYLLEAAFSRAGADLLQDSTPPLIVFTNSLDLSAAKGFPGAIRCQVDNTEIDTEGINRCLLLRSFFALSDIQVVRAMSPNEISTAYLPLGVNQHIMLTLAQEHLADYTPLQRVERDTIKAHKAIGTSIIADRATWPKLWARFTFLALCGFDSLYCFCTGTHGQLSTKPVAATGFTIDTVMSRIGIGDVLIPADRGNPRSSSIELLLRFLQSLLVSIYIKLNVDCSYELFIHKKSIAQMYKEVKNGVSMNDLTVNDLLPAPQREFRAGVISVSYSLMDLFGIDMRGCNTQGEYQDKGVFADLHKKLLLPDSYTIRGIFYRPWSGPIWDIVVESPDLPPIEQGCEAPAITPVYITVYDAEFPIQENKRYELLKIKIEDRWQQMYNPGEITLENRGKL